MSMLKGNAKKGFWQYLEMLLIVSLTTSALAACAGSQQQNNTAGSGIHKIQHIVIIMQENRSFDSYFGTFPGADGIPMENGAPAVCVPDPNTGACVQPFVDHNDLNGGGPHGAPAHTYDVNDGQMNGFIQ